MKIYTISEVYKGLSTSLFVHCLISKVLSTTFASTHLVRRTTLQRPAQTPYATITKWNGQIASVMIYRIASNLRVESRALAVPEWRAAAYRGTHIFCMRCTTIRSYAVRCGRVPTCDRIACACVPTPKVRTSTHAQKAADAADDDVCKQFTASWCCACGPFEWVGWLRGGVGGWWVTNWKTENIRPTHAESEVHSDLYARR